MFSLVRGVGGFALTALALAVGPWALSGSSAMAQAGGGGGGGAGGGGGGGGIGGGGIGGGAAGAGIGGGQVGGGLGGMGHMGPFGMSGASAGNVGGWSGMGGVNNITGYGYGDAGFGSSGIGSGPYDGRYGGAGYSGAGYGGYGMGSPYGGYGMGPPYGGYGGYGMGSAYPYSGYGNQYACGHAFGVVGMQYGDPYMVPFPRTLATGAGSSRPYAAPATTTAPGATGLAARRRYLGIDEEPVVDTGGARGMKVAKVYPGTAAAKAGIQVGDVLLSINGYRTQQPGNLAWIIANAASNYVLEINLRSVRDGQEHRLTAQLL